MYFCVEMKDMYIGKGWVEIDIGMFYQFSGGKVENLWFDYKVVIECNIVCVKVDEYYGYNYVMYLIGVEIIQLKWVVLFEMNGNME